VGLSLILGGALGNLIDRLHAGYVIDFVDVYWRGWHFWAFNVADASITIGALFVFIELLVVKRHASHTV
jgi:signal peptidase II